MIEELKRQATIETPIGHGIVKYVFSPEKFLELIVQECAEIAKHNVMNISTYADADFVEKQIKEHFGVKE